MSRNDSVGDEEDERKSYVEELIDGDELEGAALGVAKKYVADGRDSLSDKQLFVLEKYVLGKQKDCGRCGTPIPWSERYALSTQEHPWCSWCLQVTSHDD
ncbi:MAG: hypothetical protein WC764_00460 [Candidatus Paceibacterota bacterium]